MPDMNVLRSEFSLSQAWAAVGLMSAVAHGDECVNLLCEPGASTATLLDVAESELSGHGLRCVRVYGPSSGGLALRDLVAQIVDRADPNALTDHDLKAGFLTLTEPGAGCSRVVLLITEAHNLMPSALHYIQLACRAGPRLRVALAGQRGLAAALAQEEFAPLRQRIARTLELPGFVQDEAPNLVLQAPPPAPVPVGVRRVGSGAVIRLGVAAASVLIGVMGWRHGPAPLEAAMHADGPGPGDRAALVRAGPGTPATSVAAPMQVDQPSVPTQASQPSVEAAPPRTADAPNPAEPVAAQATASLAEPTAPDIPVPGQADTPPGPPAMPGESDASPAPVASGRTMEPARDAAPPAPDAIASPRATAAVSMPQPRTPAVAIPPSDAAPTRRPRGATERAAASAPALAPRPTNGRRCRDIVLQAQSGKDLSDADQSFLRDDCRAK